MCAPPVMETAVEGGAEPLKALHALLRRAGSPPLARMCLATQTRAHVATVRGAHRKGSTSGICFRGIVLTLDAIHSHLNWDC